MFEFIDDPIIAYPLFLILIILPLLIIGGLIGVAVRALPRASIVLKVIGGVLMLTYTAVMVVWLSS